MTRATQGTKEQMVRVALEQFARYSYEGASLQMIASAMGLTKPAIMYHFGSKDELLVAVAQPAFDDLETYLDGVAAQSSPTTKRRYATRGYVDLLVKHRQLMALLVQDPSVAAHPAVHDRMAGYTDSMLRIFINDWSDLGEHVYVGSALAGLRAAAADFLDIPDEELHSYLLAAAERMLSRPRRRSTTM